MDMQGWKDGHGKQIRFILANGVLKWLQYLSDLFVMRVINIEEDG